MARTGNLEKGGNKAYITINNNLPDSDGNFEITSESLGIDNLIETKANTADLATVATSNDYNDLDNLPNMGDYLSKGTNLPAEYDTAEKMVSQILKNEYTDSRGFVTSKRYNNTTETTTNGKIKITTPLLYVDRGMRSFIIDVFPYTLTPQNSYKIYVDLYYYISGFHLKNVSSDKLPYVEVYVLEEDDGTLSLEIFGLGLYQNSITVSALSRIGNRVYDIDPTLLEVQFIKDDNESTGLLCTYRDIKTESILGTSTISGRVQSSRILKEYGKVYYSGSIQVNYGYYRYLGTTETVLPSTKVELIEGEWEKLSTTENKETVLTQTEASSLTQAELDAIPSLAVTED